jgi:tetratricopeptide (TPR) repeat protein
MFRELGDRRMQVLANNTLAWITQVEGDFVSEERLRYETLDLCQRIGDRPWLIHCTGDLAYTLILRGKLSDSLSNAEECVALSVKYGFREKEGWARSNLGHPLLHLGHYDRARREIERALVLVQETGHQDIETGLWAALGYLALIPGDDGRQAQAFFEKSLRLSEKLQDEVFLGYKLGGLPLAACQVGAGDRARQYALTYLEYVIRIRHYGYLIEALAAVAFYLAHFGSKQKALAIWQQARNQPYIAASKWYEDVIGSKIQARTADLSPLPTATATNHDLWLTAESLLADLK